MTDEIKKLKNFSVSNKNMTQGPQAYSLQLRSIPTSPCSSVKAKDLSKPVLYQSGKKRTKLSPSVAGLNLPQDAPATLDQMDEENITKNYLLSP